MQCSIVHTSALQCCVVQYSALHCSVVHFTLVLSFQYCAVHRKKGQCLKGSQSLGKQLPRKDCLREDGADNTEVSPVVITIGNSRMRRILPSMDEEMFLLQREKAQDWSKVPVTYLNTQANKNAFTIHYHF